MSSYDVVVIGGGMAGAMAALAARARGKRTAMVRRALGATALSSGAIDVAADPREGSAHEGSIGTAVRALVQRRRHHPYAVLGNRRDDLLEAALAFLRQELSAHLVLGGANSLAGANLYLPTPLGTVKPTALAQGTMARGDLAAMAGARLAVLDLRGTRLLDARLIAAGINRFWKDQGVAATAEAVPVAHFHRRQDAFLAHHDVARALDQPGPRAELAASVARAVKGATHILAPPALGLADPRATLAALDEATGAKVSEALSDPPSVPGMRLQLALDARLRAAGVTLVPGDVAAPPDVKNRVERLLLAGGGEIAADAFVLATGRYIGGGIVHGEKYFAEPVFRLPVYTGAERAAAQFIVELTSPQPGGQHLAFRAGVRVDHQMRPLGEDNRPAHENLFAAGSVVSGYDPARDKCGLGAAALTGYVAGLSAAGAHALPEAPARESA